jgi:hypothetical protein
MSFAAKYVAELLQTYMLNEEYRTILLPKMAENTEQFVNAMCTYLTNDGLKICIKEKENKNITKEQYDALNSPIVYIDKLAKEFIQAYLDSVKLPNMLEYIPQNQQIGGSMFGGGEPEGSGLNKMEIPTIVQTSMSPDKLMPNLESMPMSPDKLMPNLGSTIPGMELGQDIKDKFKSNKATDIMEFLMEKVILKLKCDNNVHELIKEKIISSIFKMAGKNVDKYGNELLSPLIKVTTEQHIKKYVPLLTKQLSNYQQLLGFMAPISTTDAGKNSIKEIIPNYMNLLFELFVYCEYGLIVEIDVGITRNGIKPYVSSLKTFKEQVNANLAKYTYPADAMRLNNIKLPDSWKTEGDGNNDKDGAITDAHVVTEFKKLFETNTTPTTEGGSRKSRTKKHKTRYLPVAKHGSRRKHP